MPIFSVLLSPSLTDCLIQESIDGPRIFILFLFLFFMTLDVRARDSEDQDLTQSQSIENESNVWTEFVRLPVR